jgi:hypothetical protein
MRIIIVLALIISFLSSCYDGKSINRYFDTCVALKRPITLIELEDLFGKVYRIDGKQRKLYLFLPHKDYVMIHSSFIVAEINELNQVVRLKCSENTRVF